MIGLDTWRRLPSKTFEVTGNVPILLDGEPTVFYVESGTVACFSAECEDGVPVGPRRLLARVGSGQAVVRTPNGEEQRGLQFMIVPIQDVVLREIPLDAFCSEMSRNGAPLAPLIDGWVDTLAKILEVDAAPEIPVRLAGDHEIDLEDGQSLIAERGAVLWTRILEGVVECNGQEELEIHSGSSYLPLSDKMWLRSLEGTRIRTRSTEGLGDVETIAAGLSKLHALVLFQLKELGEKETVQEYERLREKNRRQIEQRADAVSDLAAVFEPRKARIIRETPLLTAMTAVGQAMGITINAPSKSEVEDERADPLESIARASRVRTRFVRLSGNWWKKDCGSLLAFSNDDERRPLAVIRTKRLKYEIFDPETGERVRINKKTAGLLHSEAVTLYRPLPDGKLRLLDLFKFPFLSRKRDLALVIFTGVCATVLGMITPQATAILMDSAIPEADVKLLVTLGAGLIAATLGRVTFNLSQGFVLMRLGIGSEADTQSALWDRLLRLQPSFFRNYSAGDMQSRVMAVTQIGRELSGATITTLFSSFLALLNFGLLYYYSSSLSMLAIVVAVIVIVFSLSISTFVRRKYRVLLELEGKFFGMVIQLINGVSKLKVAGAEGRAYAHWLKKYSKQLKLWSEADFLEDCMHVFNTMLPTLSSVVLYFLSFELLMEGRAPGATSGLSLGIFLAFHVAFGTFIAGITSLSDTVVGFMDIAVQGRRVKPILEAEAEIDESKADPGQLSGRFGLSRVEFRYDADGPKILDGIDLEAEPGEFIALVGSSGSGKSTIFRLLLGFESPAAGEVSYDGQDLASLDVLAVRRQFGVVLQGGSLDAGSIFENISCGNVISLDEAWAAADAAGFGDEVREMPMGMHTIVSVGGGNLSGGQRQRLLIARSLANRPRILLFDEATSALDNRTQAIVSRSLEQLKVTRFVIAHRLSTIRNANRIYVLDGGKIVEKGRFEDLMKNEGLFSRLMARQMA